LVIRVSIVTLSSRMSKPISAGPGFRLHRSAREGETTDRPARGSEEGWGDLLAAAQRGDAAAYRAFLEAALPFLRSVARARSWSAAAAEDVVQDALLTLHRVRHTYQPGRPVKPWLAAIAVRRAIDSNRRLGRTTAREVHDPLAHETFAAEPANRDEAADAAVRLARMMEGLTPKQKEAVDLVKLREMSLTEASAESGQSIASLKVNVHRAIRKLRSGLDLEERE
jgi:RNA polymerase sigma-70 factor (ECF subfamily)